jgi:hypothetical protein
LNIGQLKPLTNVDLECPTQFVQSARSIAWFPYTRHSALGASAIRDQVFRMPIPTPPKRTEPELQLVIDMPRTEAEPKRNPKRRRPSMILRHDQSHSSLHREA